MGRKSNKKKLVKKLLEEKKITNFKKISKEDKKKLKAKLLHDSSKKDNKNKSKNSLQLYIRDNLQKILGVSISLVSLVLIIVFSYFLLQYTFKPYPVSKLLPAQNTEMMVEINTDIEHLQNLKTFKILEKNPLYTKENLTRLINTAFTLDFEKDISPWLGRQAVIAMVDLGIKQEKTNFLAFVEFKNKEFLLNALKNSTVEKDYKEFKIYKIVAAPSAIFIENSGFDAPKYFVLHKKYLVLSPYLETMEGIIDFWKSDEQKLYFSKHFRRIEDNMPLSKIAYVYINYEKLSPILNKILLASVGEKNFIEYIKPFSGLFSAEAFALIASDNYFVLQSFLSSEQINKVTTPTKMEPEYSGQLMKYLSPETISFWGGKNLKEKIEILANMKNGSTEANNLNYILSSLTSNNLGTAVDFYTDLLPLFDNEYLISLEKIDGKNSYSVFLQISDEKTIHEKLLKCLNGFIQIKALSKPQTVEHVLEDGTVSTEIIAVPQEIIESRTSYKDIEIINLQIGEDNFDIYYAIFDNTALISTQIQSIQNSIDRRSNTAQNFMSQSDNFKDLERIIQNTQEISYFNIERLYEVLPVEIKPEILSPFANYSSGKIYFNDGIVGINFIELK